MTSAPLSPTTLIVLTVRALVELAAVIVIGVWGFSQFAFPFPALVAGIGAPAFAMLMWALFVSPKSVFNVDAFGKALVEIVLFSAAGLAMVFMGWPWWAALLLVGAGSATGIISGRAQL
ncbi:MAG: YrdB family protein [Agromyces sp.]